MIEHITMLRMCPCEGFSNKFLNPLKFLPTWAWLAVFLSSSVQSNPVPIENDFQVNVNTVGHQAFSSISSDSIGNFVVVWRGPNYGTVNSIWARRFDSSGQVVGGEILVNSHTPFNASQPSVGVSSDGGFVVAWNYVNLGNGPSEDPSSGVFARRFDSTGSPISAEFHVNEFTLGAQRSPRAAVAPNGQSVIVWTSKEQDGSGYGVYARLYDAVGQPRGTEFLVNSSTHEDQTDPDVGMDSQGNFIIVWRGIGLVPTHRGIFGQMFNSDGSRRGNEWRIESGSNYGSPSTSMDGSGRSVTTWEIPSGILAQRFNSDGLPVGEEIQVIHSSALQAIDPSVVVDRSGGFAIAWFTTDSDRSDSDVWMRVYDSNSSPLGTELRVNAYTTSAQVMPEVEILDNNKFVVTWTDGSIDRGNGQDGFGQGVFARRFTVEDEKSLDTIAYPTPAILMLMVISLAVSRSKLIRQRRKLIFNPFQ